MNFAFWLSLTVFLISAGSAIEIAFGLRKMKRLEDTIPAIADNPPKISIIVSALNEANTIEPALQSLLALDYPNMEIIAINDRSTDATPEILDRMSQAHPRLRVLHLSELPSGWLGKNHALYRGAQLASGDYLIFTDADVIFDPSTVSRAATYCEQHHVDHLTLIFNIVAKTQLLRMLLLNFQIGFALRFKPWKVNTSPKHFLGLGGFNMLRRSAYQKSGGHAAIPMAVADDMMLGKLIKTKGYLQHALSARELVSVEWYRSTPEMLEGLEKSVFYAVGYQISQLIAVTLLMLVLRILPWVGLFVTDGITRLLNVATILAGFALFADFLHSYGWGYRCLVFLPVISFVELVMWWRGSLLTLLRGGIEWRGTHYPLRELKRSPFGKL